MNLSDFDYEYPKELIAQHPLAARDESRMMVVHRSDSSFSHSGIKEIASFIEPGDIVVINETKVAPARIFGKRGNGEETEILLIEQTKTPNLWKALLKRAKKIRPGEKFFFGMQATATARGRDGIYLMLEFKGNSLKLAMEKHGVPPLPPYIERRGFEAYSQEDRERYQTVYARHTGSAAAPTAGLHLTPQIVRSIEDRKASVEKIVLHVGIDTFAPVRAEKLDDHKMHGERVIIQRETSKKILTPKKLGRRIVAVGTTTTRALESAALRSETGEIAHDQWTTDLFIKPGFEFKVVDAMLTNFHQPKSTLLVMISAFAGREFILSCYEEAIKERYRLFSFGDCMLIL